MTEANRNEAKYRELSVPKETPEKANEDINAFFKELGELREKYALPECLCVLGVNVDYGEGKEGTAITWMSYGDNMKAEGLAAYAYGQAQAEHREIMNRLLRGKKRD
jgi:hypothetical protein